MIYIKNKAILPDCPYCGAKLGYLESFAVKNRSTYKCRSCKKKSSVDLSHMFYNVLWTVLVVSVVIFVLSTLIGGGFALFGLWLILMDFAVFYGISPYMVKLKKPRKRRIQKKKNERNMKKSKAENLEARENPRKAKHEEEAASEPGRDIFSS